MQKIPPSKMALRQQGFLLLSQKAFTSYEMKILGKCLYLNERQSLSVCGSHWAGSCPSPAPPLVFLSSAQWGLCSKAEQNVCLEFSGTINRYSHPHLALKISLFSLLSSHPPLGSHLCSLLLKVKLHIPYVSQKNLSFFRIQSPLLCYDLRFLLRKSFSKEVTILKQLSSS